MVHGRGLKAPAAFRPILPVLIPHRSVSFPNPSDFIRKTDDMDREPRFRNLGTVRVLVLAYPLRPKL
jgi:hypothetical protein